VDFKRELTRGSGANKEHARDMAQFAIDGGVLVVGVDDNDKTRPPQLTPVDLDGLPERVDQIARSLVDEPLHVRIQVLEAAGQPGKGYLLVVVPPSPSAPHQVAGRYYGRGDTTKNVLSDAEVQRLHQLALRRQRDAEDLLDEEVRQDPWPPAPRGHAHLFGVAQPVSARPDLLQQVLKDPPGWHGSSTAGSAAAPQGSRCATSGRPIFPTPATSPGGRAAGRSARGSIRAAGSGCPTATSRRWPGRRATSSTLRSARPNSTSHTRCITG
jgi:hypothetical protein